MYNKHFFISFVLLMLIGVLHVISAVYSFYWRFWWFDIIMHSLAGFWVATTVFWFFKVPSIHALIGKNFVLSYSKVIALVMLVGVLWEIYEYIYGLTYTSGNYYILDTAKDLFFDFASGSFAYYVYKK